MRLDKFVCKSTDLNRTQAQTCIQQGEVRVNDDLVLDIKSQVHKNNQVKLKQTLLTLRPFRYILLHKPANTLCSNLDENYPSLFNFLEVEHKDELHIVGRLDVDTTGMVLITDDGHWSFNITRPSMACIKEYRVGLSSPLAQDAIEQFKQGITLQGETELTLPANLHFIDDKNVLLGITQGKFHQVKRMFAAVGNRVVRLHRQKIGAIMLDVPEGQWRYLTASEIESFDKPINANDNRTREKP